jgi:metal-responsive CopG/Arc/MetJ family transcriptional regulator
MIGLKSSLEDLMPSRWRVTVYLPEEMQKALEQWAAKENRSTSNLAATILIGAIKEYQEQNETPESGTSSGGKGSGKEA